MEDDYSDFGWLADGGWMLIDSATPCEEILEVVQANFAYAPALPAMMSLRGGPWPAGVWHWEPEGCASSVEPTHYRRSASASASVHARARATA